ncbi:MAG: hypothetical protein HeimC3_00100 [Candidatus Heimdallarchaeota archaeon LC_3]|nr:MAG: hypothetical protein HeimC3_00100 [Candidatus Heimdallarchaeota archaeon LC_3]
MTMRNLFNLWIVSIIITFIILVIINIGNNEIFYSILAILSGIFSSLVFIILIGSIITTIEKQDQKYKLLEGKLSEKDLLFDKQLEPYLARIDKAETTKELEFILEEMSISNVKIKNTEKATSLKKRIQLKYKELSNEGRIIDPD